MRVRAKLAVAVVPVALTAMVAFGATSTAGASGVDAITSSNTATAFVGSLFTFQVTTTGSVIPNISLQGLGNPAIVPAGLTFTDNGDGTATITGTPPPIVHYLMYTFRVGKLYHPTIIATFRSGRTKVVVKQVLMLAVDQAPIISSASMKTVRAGKTFTFTVKEKS
jgi:hypothetical protein